jgi:hypothetical protein
MHHPAPTPTAEQTLQYPSLCRRPLIELQISILDHEIQDRSDGPLEWPTGKIGGDPEGGGGLVPAFGAVANEHLCGLGGRSVEVDEATLTGCMHFE